MHSQVIAAAQAHRSTQSGQKVMGDAQGDARMFCAVAVSPDGRLFATHGADGHVAVWHAGSAMLVRRLQHPSANATHLAWSPDGSQLAVPSTRDGSITVCNVLTGAVKATLLQFHHGRAASAAWTPHGLQIFTCDYDSDTCSLWNGDTGDLLHELEGCFRVLDVSWSPDGAFVASGSMGINARVTVWDTTTGEAVRVLPGDGNGYRPRVRTAVQCVAWGPDGSMLVSASTSSDVVVMVWDAASGDPKYTLQCSGIQGMSVAWSPDGRLLVTGSRVGTLTLWATDTGTRVRLVRCESSSPVWSVAWSPCGQVLLAAHRSGVTICNVSEYCQ